RGLSKPLCNPWDGIHFLSQIRVLSGGNNVHRHDAHAFVYMLEGQIVMQLKGQPAVTLSAGQTFYEGPTDVHVVGRNASNREPARFVVVLLKAKGAPILTPVQDQ